MKSMSAKKSLQGGCWKVWQAGTTKPSRMATGAGKAVHKYYTPLDYNPLFPAFTLPERKNNIIKRRTINQRNSLEKPVRPPESQGDLDYLGKS